jgi:hypothetical protein
MENECRGTGITQVELGDLSMQPYPCELGLPDNRDTYPAHDKVQIDPRLHWD